MVLWVCITVFGAPGAPEVYGAKAGLCGEMLGGWSSTAVSCQACSVYTCSVSIRIYQQHVGIGVRSQPW